MLWKLHFIVYSNFKIKIGSYAVTKLRSENLWRLRTAIIINKSTEDSQLNELNKNGEMRVTGK